MSCFITHYASPLGCLLLAADEEGLTGLWLEGQKYFAAGLPQQREEQRTPVLEEACRWLDTYFTGREPDFYSAAASCGLGFSAGGVAASAADPLWADHHLWRAGRGTGVAARPDTFFGAGGGRRRGA